MPGSSNHISSRKPSHNGFLCPCVKLEELYIGDESVEVPNAFTHYILGSIPSRIVGRLTTERSDLSHARGIMWGAPDEALACL